MKKLVYIVFCVVLLAFVSNTVWADTLDWKQDSTRGPGADNNWFNTNNWSWGTAGGPPAGILPDLTVTNGNVRMHQSTACSYANSAIIADGDALANVINIGGAPSNAEPYGRLTINSGTLTVAAGIRCGGSSSSNRSGQFFVNGGTVNITDYLAVGYGPAAGNNVTGWLYMTGGIINAGTFDIGRIANTNGYADISGGTIYASTDFRMRPAGGAGVVSLNLSGTGRVIIAGDKTAAITTYIESGWINDNVLYDYNISNAGKTTIYIPEPATVCLLGLGVFGLLRRK